MKKYIFVMFAIFFSFLFCMSFAGGNVALAKSEESQTFAAGEELTIFYNIDDNNLSHNEITYGEYSKINLHISGQSSTPPEMLKLYHYKQNSGNGKYNSIPMQELIVEGEDYHIEYAITNVLKSVGTFSFIISQTGGEALEDIKQFEISVLGVNSGNVSVNLRYNEIQGNPGRLGTYELIALISGLNEGENYTILWYLADGNAKLIIRSGNNAKYTPSQTGLCVIEYALYDSNGTLISSSGLDTNSYLTLNVTVNNYYNIFIYVSAIVAGLIIIFTISVIIKVKSEKVW